MKIVNQKPAVLTPVYNDDITKNMDVVKIATDCLSKTVFTPLIPSQPVTMTYKGNNYTEQNFALDVLDCCGENININAETLVKSILNQTLLTYNAATPLGVAELFPVQSGTAENMPEPDGNVVYTPSTDVIPACRQFLAGQASYDKFFASLAYYARPETLGFYFANEIAFDEFIKWITNQFAAFSTVLTPDDNKLAADFMTLKLTELTESILLRKNDGDHKDPNSFARLLIKLLMQYTKIVSEAEFGVLPFNVGELFCPKSVVFVNVEKHSKASSKAIANEWKLINNSLQNKNQINMISNKKLTRLTAVQRALKKAQVNAAAAAQFMKTGGAGKAASFKFSKTRPTQVDLTKFVKKIISKMAFVNTSMNTFKSSKVSFAKPNRRDPDDFNKMGKVVSTRYLPDIHLYIDTSGSISERDYQDTVKACIALAKKLGIDMYFNSFSHFMSQTTKLNIAGKTQTAIYNQFQKVPKVTGGTDYEQIWNFINMSKKRKRELSIIITDFEWSARTSYVEHPKNLYYVPCSTMNWTRITRLAEYFCQSMLHNDPNIRKHILF